MLRVFPIGLWIFSFVRMLHSRQPQRFGLFGLLLALSLVHVSPPAQADLESGGVAVALELPTGKMPAAPAAARRCPRCCPRCPRCCPRHRRRSHHHRRRSRHRRRHRRRHQPPPPPPGSREIQGELRPDRPTIVLTHGLEADAASLWTGFSATPGAQGAGHILNNLLGQQVNIVQFLWEEGLQGFSPSAYRAAFPYTQDAGAKLADLLMERLGPGYQHPIHFIGHSLGAVVNAYAARQFLTRDPRCEALTVYDPGLSEQDTRR